PRPVQEYLHQGAELIAGAECFVAFGILDPNRISDSGFQIPDCGCPIPDSGLQIPDMRTAYFGRPSSPRRGASLMTTETPRSDPGEPGCTVTRRAFLAGAGAAAAGFAIVPRHVLGGGGYVAPSEKVTIAFIGTGSQGLRVMLTFLRNEDVQGVAVCDPN